MEQQTAVEWFMDNIPTRFKNAILNECSEEIEKAKQMEKEQIIKAVDSNFSYNNNGYPTLGEQYYNETYGR
jgi:hypothetical protein